MVHFLMLSKKQLDQVQRDALRSVSLNVFCARIKIIFQNSLELFPCFGVRA